jgi:uncharacterized protein YndB with AHSA1/START domain
VGHPPTTTLVPSIEKLTLNINLETHVEAPIEATFEALLEQLGPGFNRPDGSAMPMKLEARPGGRWFRDLGDDNGHFWANVQAIKRPTLLEFSGPLMLSHAVTHNVQYRLSEVKGGTLITFHHQALGFIPDDVRENMVKGWSHIQTEAARRAQAKR